MRLHIRHLIFALKHDIYSAGRLTDVAVYMRLDPPAVTCVDVISPKGAFVFQWLLRSSNSPYRRRKRPESARDELYWPPWRAIRSFDPRYNHFMDRCSADPDTGEVHQNARCWLLQAPRHQRPLLSARSPTIATKTVLGVAGVSATCQQWGVRWRQQLSCGGCPLIHTSAFIIIVNYSNRWRHWRRLRLTASVQ